MLTFSCTSFRSASLDVEPIYTFRAHRWVFDKTAILFEKYKIFKQTQRFLKQFPPCQLVIPCSTFISMLFKIPAYFHLFFFWCWIYYHFLKRKLQIIQFTFNLVFHSLQLLPFCHVCVYVEWNCVQWIKIYWIIFMEKSSIFKQGKNEMKIIQPIISKCEMSELFWL